MIGSVETTRGPVLSTGLRATLLHEHIFIRNPELDAEYPDPSWDEELLVERARTRMRELYDAGIGTFVDLTVLGLGRFAPRIRDLAADLPINIVLATGYYVTRDLPAFFHNNGPGRMIDGPEPLERMFLRDLTEGIGDSGVKAGVLKAITDVHGLAPDVERVLAAVCHAHRETGAPIITHSHVESHGSSEQLDYLRNAGVDLERVVIGHCGDSTDLDYLMSLMDQGVVIGMDRFGAAMFLDDAARIATVVELCKRGYADRMVLSHDASIYSVNSSPSWRSETYPDWNHLFIPTKVLPRLLEAGVTPEQVDTMMVQTPARILTGSSATA